MIEMNANMPNKVDKSLLLIGLCFYLVGQVWINVTGSMTSKQIAIDGIHWLMLVGASLLLPFSARLPRTGIAAIAGPFMLVGIVLVIGSCVVDFVLWSVPEQPFRGEVSLHLIHSPMIWKPFIVISGYIFTPALAFASFVYMRWTKLGPLLAIAGMVTIGAGPIWTNIPGYILIIAAFMVCFSRECIEKTKQEQGKAILTRRN